MALFRSMMTLVCAATLLTACSGDLPILRDETAKRTAAPVFMIPRNIPSEKFIIQAYERVHQKHHAATIYIEGDGVSTVAIKALNDAPTPTDPVALRLAAQDGGPNVIWLARPCQYNTKYNAGGKSEKICPAAYATTKRFAPDVIDTYNQVLNNIKAYYNIPAFNLVGYDGGATIAVILASQRADISSLRTVAGNLDPKTLANVTKTPYSTESLNPVDFAAGITNIPQRHFIGKLDSDMPPAVYGSFSQAAGQDTHCMNVTLVDHADHTSGWVEQWNVLKDIPTDCATLAEPAPVPFDPTPLDGDKTHIKRKK